MDCHALTRKFSSNTNKIILKSFSRIAYLLYYLQYSSLYVAFPSCAALFLRLFICFDVTPSILIPPNCTGCLQHHNNDYVCVAISLIFTGR